MQLKHNIEQSENKTVCLFLFATHIANYCLTLLAICNTSK